MQHSATLENSCIVGRYCGPIVHPNMPVMQNTDGVQAVGYRYTPQGEKSSWQAEWIWLNAREYPEYQLSPCTSFCKANEHQYAVALFRKEVTLDADPQQIIAWVSGDTKYRLYINGRMAGRGPAEVGGDFGNQQAPDWWFYDRYDVTPLFHKGINIISAEVALQGDVQADYSMGHGGFLFEAEVVTAQGKATLKSDSSWRGIRNAADVAPEIYDARLAPTDWHEPGFDDKTWPHTDTLGISPQGRWSLVSREIPPLMEALYCATEVIPLTEFTGRVRNAEAMLHPDTDSTMISPGTPITFLLRFDREIAGHAQFTVRGAAGTAITVGYAETADGEHGCNRYTLRDGLQSFEIIRLHGFQYLRVTIDFNHVTTPLEIMYLGATFTSYPVEYRGTFQCSDDTLNAIWHIGCWTNQLYMQGYHLDSPIHQEGLGCTGDYMIESLMNYATFGDTWLTRQDLLRTAYLLRQKRGIMFHTSYSLLWVQMLADYLDYSGDMELVTALLPDLHNLLTVFAGYVGKTGLITEAPNYLFMDWVPLGEYNLHHPPCHIGQGYMSAFYYQALRCGARLCRLAGSPEYVQKYDDRAEAIKSAFNRELWVEERGLYCDGKPGVTTVEPSQWLPKDNTMIYFSQHTNALAVAYDLAPATRQTDIMHRVLHDATLTQAEPYFMHFVLNAIAHAGLFSNYGCAQLRRWKRLIDEHAGSLKETWTWGDYSHAWGGTPTFQLSTRILGVMPETPGFSTTRIAPEFGDLTWARGEFPTPHGPITVAWQRADHDYTIDTTIPDGITAQLILPASTDPVMLEPGKHTFTGCIACANDADISPVE
ncbi:MAG TPA: alpha-L-rhamnosidase C-terminal domain-containing protein [Armatimonadota bacterium]|nr:alpha-L-rhamnosidase C-terminal domain-containing protein [Armatimonadota bacterium]